MKTKFIFIFTILFALLGICRDVKACSSITELQDFTFSSNIHLALGDTDSALELINYTNKSVVMTSEPFVDQANFKATFGLTSKRAGIPFAYDREFKNAIQLYEKVDEENLSDYLRKIIVNDLRDSYVHNKDLYFEQLDIFYAFTKAIDLRLQESNSKPLSLQELNQIAFSRLFMNNYFELLNPSSRVDLRNRMDFDDYIEYLADYETHSLQDTETLFDIINILPKFKKYKRTTNGEYKEGLLISTETIFERYNKAIGYKLIDSGTSFGLDSGITRNSRIPIFSSFAFLNPLENLNARLNTPPPCPNCYATIEIGSTGVKWVVFKLNTEITGNRELVGTNKASSSINTLFTNFTEPSTEETISAVIRFHKMLVETYLIMPRNISIAISSGVLRSAGNDLSRNTHIADLIQGLNQTASVNESRIFRLSNEDEPKLALIGLIPMSMRGGYLTTNYRPNEDRMLRTALLDIGGGNAKGGKFDYDPSNERLIFDYFSNSLGLNRITKEQEMQNPQTYISDIERYLSTTGISEEISSGVSKLTTKNNIILNGGIFWAIASHVKPNLYFETDSTRQINFIELSLTDVLDFKEIIQSNFGKIASGDPETIRGLLSRGEVSESNRSAAELGIATVYSRLNEDYIKAGVVLAEKYFRAISNSSIQKRFVFARYGESAWPFGLGLENLGY